MTFGANHLYHTSNHLLGSIEVGYHTVSQRSDRAYIFMGFTMHQTSFFTEIEARVLGDLAMNHIIPVATQYQTDLINNVYKMQSLFPADKAARLSAKNLELIEEIADRTAFIKEHVDAMIEARKVANKIESEREKAIAYHDTIVPALEEIRYHIDKLELIVDNQMWTLPKYRELLFVR